MLQKLVCKTRRDTCPYAHYETNIFIDSLANEYKRSYAWSLPARKEEAQLYHCKYKIQVARGLLNVEDSSQNGYTMVQVEQYGF